MKHLNLVKKASPALLGSIANALAWSGAMQFTGTFGTTWADEEYHDYLMSFNSLLKHDVDVDTVMELMTSDPEQEVLSKDALAAIAKTLGTTAEDLQAARATVHATNAMRTEQVRKVVAEHGPKIKEHIKKALQSKLLPPPKSLSEDLDAKLVAKIKEKALKRRTILLGLATTLDKAVAIKAEIDELDKFLKEAA